MKYPSSLDSFVRPIISIVASNVSRPPQNSCSVGKILFFFSFEKCISIRSWLIIVFSFHHRVSNTGLSSKSKSAHAVSCVPKGRLWTRDRSIHTTVVFSNRLKTAWIIMWNDNNGYHHGCHHRTTVVGQFFKRRQQHYYNRDYQSKMKTVDHGTLPIMQVSSDYRFRRTEPHGNYIRRSNAPCRKCSQNFQNLFAHVQLLLVLLSFRAGKEGDKFLCFPVYDRGPG